MTAHQRGTTTVADRVVRKIAEQAAREAVTGRGGSLTKGSASVHGRTARVGVDVALAYRGSAGEAARLVQDHVAARTRHLTDLRLPAPRVSVRALTTPAGAPGPTGDEVSPAPEGARRRRWSERRLPVALFSIAALVGAGALVHDAAAVLLWGHPSAPWRRDLVDWLAGNGPADTPAWAAAVAAVAGLWMIALALTPGRRKDLTMAMACDGVRAVISRRSAGHLITAALTQVPGITAGRARVGRRRVRVRAEFADIEKARALEEVGQAIAAAVRELGLAAPLRTRVRLRPSRLSRSAPPTLQEEDLDGPHA
ncbi:DUF6286 domain-containing Asp23/Gls24 family envelope stress response protein [Streptomyces sp. NPDC059917]|uniref:DUF6286 domain-containing Asp23/Gls24 family envelope stress response protein n=1 Tax=Streptomyces sp. NPDC059917 TaxID=3347002 RepID=UPI0036534660